MNAFQHSNWKAVVLKLPISFLGVQNTNKKN